MKTKAAVLYELHKPLIIKDVEIPKLRRGQVLAKILRTGICRAQYNEMIGLKGPDPFLPHLLGHEASAIVVKTGAGVKKVKAGDYVALSWIKGSGIEAGGAQYRCGDEIINAGGVTTFSEYSVVSENRVTRISRKLSADVAAIIGCAVVTGAGIVNNTLHLSQGSSIAVFGAGGIGLSVILAAKYRGCSDIIAVDVKEDKLDFAKTLGATHTINIQTTDVLKSIREICKGGVDYAVDASGAKAAMETAFDAIRVGGTLVIAGNLSKDEKISIHPFELIKGKKILGTWGGETVTQRDIPAYVRAYLKGDFPIHKLITHQYRLEQINEAFEVLKRGEAGRIIIKVCDDQP
ncbi:MAG: zinc-binding dehydrogenase [Candidatus Omnitrophota bacterium]